MSIEITGKSASPITTGLNHSAKKEQQSDARSSHTTADISSKIDEVNVTSMAMKLNDLAKRSAAEPVVDTQRISAIKTEIEHGSYVVNASRVAEKFFRFELALSH